MRVYKGYGLGTPVYTIKDNRIYERNGLGTPVYTIKITRFMKDTVQGVLFTH